MNPTTEVGRQPPGGDSRWRVVGVSLEHRPAAFANLRRAQRVQFRECAAFSELAEIVSDWNPRLVIFDTLSGGSQMRSLLSETRSFFDGISALLVVRSTGDEVRGALDCGADTVLLAPADEVSVQRILARHPEKIAKRRKEHTLRAVSLAADSPSMTEVWHRALLSSQTDATVLVSGESGTGKEVIARAIQRFSPQQVGPFVAVNCAALPETLLESELFGHEKGAFTGAMSQRIGRFEQANGGTLFLDEIGDLPLVLQVKLLRVLQERTLERLGGTRTLEASFRLISATNQNLEALVEEQAFRSDLFYRLNVVRIDIPPLRERRADILTLWNGFLAEGAKKDFRETPETSLEAKRLLLNHDWPGNVRELYNASQYALTASTAARLGPGDLPPSLRSVARWENCPSLLGMTLKDVERALLIQTYNSVGTVEDTASMVELSARTIQYRFKEYRRQGWDSKEDLARRETSNVVETAVPARILLAEDDDELRWALTDLLEAEGYSVAAVPSGADALHEIDTAVGAGVWPHVVITDLRMPGITGIELLRDLSRRGIRAPVIVVSAFGDEFVRREAEELGARAFLEKPIAPGVLQDALVQIFN